MTRHIYPTQEVNLPALAQALERDADNKSLDHYGRASIASALGEGVLAKLLDARQWEQSGLYVPPESSSGLRYVVVGFRHDGTAPRPAAVVLASSAASALAKLPSRGSGERQAAELVLVRSGLMRRETAELLAEVLGHSAALAGELSWVVSEGPAVDGNLRSWLDECLGVPGMVLQFVLGWGLSCGSVSMPASLLQLTEQAAWHGRWAVAEDHLLEPAPRYCLTGTAKGGSDGLPDEYEVWVHRAEPDEVALELVSMLEHTGLLFQGMGRGHASRVEPAQAIAQELWPMFGTSARSAVAARVYASGFTAAELPDVIESLEREGLTGLRVRDWRDEAPKSTDPYCDGEGLSQRSHQVTAWLAVGRVSGVEVSLQSVMPLPLHLPESEWPQWALESKAMLEAYCSDQEWQHREQVQEYLDEDETDR